MPNRYGRPVDTLANWRAANPVIYYGEEILIRLEDGHLVGLIGDDPTNSKRFAEYTDYQIDYTGTAKAARDAKVSESAAKSSEIAAKASADTASGKAEAVRLALNNLPAGAVPVINDLTTGGTAAALSAEQGKVLWETSLNKANVEWVKGLTQLPGVVGGSIAEAIAGHVANGIKCGNFSAMSCTDIPDGSTSWGFNMSFFQGEHTVVIAKRSYSPAMWYAELDSNGWESEGWIRLATATPPQEYDLPLAEGFSIGNIWYHKTQDDIVTVNFTNLIMQEGTYIVGDVIVGTLPVGYRPTGLRDGSCTLHSDDGSAAAAIIRIHVDGSIHVINGAANQRSIHGEVSFVAAA